MCLGGRGNGEKLIESLYKQAIFLLGDKENSMNDTSKRFFWISVFAIAMALLEAVVVAYIRGLHQLTNNQAVLGPYMTMEIWREGATLVMLIAVGWLTGRQSIERLAYGLFAFGLWDIWYYVWLKVFLDWPATLLDWDILFLIPMTWWGPVLSPVLIAGLICVTTILAIVRTNRGEPLNITPTRAGLIGIGGLLALYIFMSSSLHALLQGRPDWDSLGPEPFKWPLFLIALMLMAWPSLSATWPGQKSKYRRWETNRDIPQ